MKKELKRMALFATIGMLVFCFSGCEKTPKNNPIPQVSKEKPKRPENMSEAEKEIWDKSEILDVIDVSESDMLTEEEAIKFFEDRGFNDYPIIYLARPNGEVVLEDSEADKASKEKHPIYQTCYRSKKTDSLYILLLINDSVYVTPISYLLETEAEKEMLISETKELTSYLFETKKFYVTIPKTDELHVKMVKRIDKEMLDKLVLSDESKKEAK